MFDIFSLPDFTFPKGFLFGSSTAGHQIEGDNIHSNFWDIELKREPKPFYEPSGKACNHYNMVEEDVALLKSLGHKAYRMSVEWSRIEPEDGVFDKEATEHYVRELALLKESGIQTFVTLVHATMPLWFTEKGEFGDLDNFKYFERYLRYILPKISPYVDFWNIFNEFNDGVWKEAIDRKYNYTIAHARAYYVVKEFSSAPVSSAHAFIRFVPLRSDDPFDKAMQAFRDAAINEFFFHAMRTGELVLPGKEGIYDKSMKDTCDFWSINTYVRTLIDARTPSGEANRFPFRKMQMVKIPFYLEEFDPECLFSNLSRLYDKPVYITENGCSCDNDDFRIVFIAEYLSAVSEAIKKGIDVKGYLYWSMMDNYEWGSYAPRFGLIDVDREHNYKRTIKPSGYFYKEIIENNGFSQKILQKYLKDMPRL